MTDAPAPADPSAAASNHAPSWYAATANPAPERPSLATDIVCDVAIVGGGFTGLGAALALAAAGHDVRLFEAERIGWGASGRNGGQAIAGLRHGAVALAARFGDPQARALLDVAAAARDHFWRVIAEHAIDCSPVRGHLIAAARPGHLADLDAEVAALLRLGHGDGVRLLDAAEVDAGVGGGRYHGGLLDAGGGHVHPLNLALGLAAAAEAAGAVLHERSRVTAVAAGRLAVNGHAVRARHVVIAADSETGRIAPELGSKILNIGNTIVATAHISADTAILSSNWAVADTRFVLDYYRRTPDNRLLFAGGEKYLPGPPADRAAFVRPHLERVFPQLAGIPIDYAWGGDVAVTRTRHALVGRRGDTFHALGYSGQGVVLASFIGTLIAEAVAGDSRRFDLLADLPAGPFPGGRALRGPLQVAAMLWYALRDRL